VLGDAERLAGGVGVGREGGGDVVVAQLVADLRHDHPPEGLGSLPAAVDGGVELGYSSASWYVSEPFAQDIGKYVITRLIFCQDFFTNNLNIPSLYL